MTAALQDKNTFPHADEEFMEIVGFPQYLVSTYGRAYSVRRKMFITAQTTGGNSAPRITVSVDGQLTSLPLAATVLTAFGQRPPRPRAMPRWIDGDVHNCALANLEWV